MLKALQVYVEHSHLDLEEAESSPTSFILSLQPLSRSFRHLSTFLVALDIL